MTPHCRTITVQRKGQHAALTMSLIFQSQHVSASVIETGLPLKHRAECWKGEKVKSEHQDPHKHLAGIKGTVNVQSATWWGKMARVS